MTLRVHIVQPTEDSVRLEVARHVSGGIAVSWGPDLPNPADFQVLVNGRPSEAMLKASRHLDTLIIPWAGLPPETAAVLKTFPGVAVHNLHYNATVTAETGILLLLAAAKRLVVVDRALRNHDWRPRFDESGALELAGRNATVLGYGAIGKRVTQVCQAMGMRTTAFRRASQPGDPEFVRPLSVAALREILPTTEALLVTLPLTSETEGVIGAPELALLPDNAIVVNIARGKVIDQEALYAECRAGRIRAGLDVWYNYPRTEEARANMAPSDFPFEVLDNVVMTPHMGGNSDRESIALARELAGLLNARARGETLPNRLDPSRGY